MHLPSLKSIEAFEVAAKHLNFTKAGDELNLTSAAISQRVAMLESTLGYSLFHRNGPRLTLTDTGKSCLPVLSRALRQTREAVNSLEDIAETSLITIKTSPSFAQKWLIPKIGRFRDRHPEIDLRILGSSDRIDIKEGELIAAVYYGIDLNLGLADNLGVDRLFEERVFPVCSPDFQNQHGPFGSLSDLARVPLLHDETMSAMAVFPSWRRWCENFELTNIDTSRGLRFRVSELAVQATVEGQGMGLGRGALVRHDVESGKLVRPFKEAYPLSFGYQFVYSKLLLQRPDFEPVRQWLADEARDYERQRSDY